MKLNKRDMNNVFGKEWIDQRWRTSKRKIMSFFDGVLIGSDMDYIDWCRSHSSSTNSTHWITWYENYQETQQWPVLEEASFSMFDKLTFPM